MVFIRCGLGRLARRGCRARVLTGRGEVAARFCGAPAVTDQPNGSKRTKPALNARPNLLGRGKGRSLNRIAVTAMCRGPGRTRTTRASLKSIVTPGSRRRRRQRCPQDSRRRCASKLVFPLRCTRPPGGRSSSPPSSCRTPPPTHTHTRQGRLKGITQGSSHWHANSEVFCSRQRALSAGSLIVSHERGLRGAAPGEGSSAAAAAAAPAASKSSPARAHSKVTATQSGFDRRRRPGCPPQSQRAARAAAGGAAHVGSQPWRQQRAAPWGSQSKHCQRPAASVAVERLDCHHGAGADLVETWAGGGVRE